VVVIRGSTGTDLLGCDTFSHLVLIYAKRDEVELSKERRNSPPEVYIERRCGAHKLIVANDLYNSDVTYNSKRKQSIIVHPSQSPPRLLEPKAPSEVNYFGSLI